jgi:SAM-dependent methyltransferase
MAHQMVRSTGQESGTYDCYVRTEWELFASDPARSSASRQAVAGLPVARVLDLGCGAGQELLPFLPGSSTLGVGIDVSPEVGLAGRPLFATARPGSRVACVRAAAESLPLATSSVDVVICRLALPYTDNNRALAEMARVLRPEGRLLLKFHHARYYAASLADAVTARRLKPAVHACRVLLAGGLYHLTGSQPRGRFLGRETFQTWWLLRRELSRHGLVVRGMLDDSVPAAPTLLIGRAESR